MRVEAMPRFHAGLVMLSPLEYFLSLINPSFTLLPPLLIRMAYKSNVIEYAPQSVLEGASQAHSVIHTDMIISSWSVG